MTSIKKTFQNVVSTVKQTVKDNEKLIKGGTAVVSQTSKAISFGKDAIEQIGKVGKKPVEGILGSKGLGFISNPTFDAGKFGAFQKVMAKAKGPLGAVSVFTAGKAVTTAVGDIRNAVRSGSREDITKAVRSSLDAAKAGLNVVSGGIQGSKVAGGILHAKVVAQKLGAEKAALDAFKRVAPKASEAVAKAASGTALKQVFEGATAKAARRAITETATKVAQETAGSIARGAGSASRAAGKAVLSAAGREAGEAALKAGARAAAGPAAKAAARFAPGLNVAMAAVDTAQAVATLADSKASTGKKVTSVITAVGSIAAATNIPIVSQVGAAVSTVSSIIGAFF
ncbi:hypothetical protein JY651_03825 [Pyxidicoccus parkwayensis]|uniref:Uncharacterized protein n=1 Tax=Pyxidicoccus parkwayensis TaxID=2813578 RepID=A0ABX7P1U9_9BACT|nr:hypothetical protein [Pyxidicoccus parkwaysis]QSQ24115.1 hypothetical protein JY651_03825 [Pyxidicoccus parkwaysis]